MIIAKVEGIYRNGQVELIEQPLDIREGARVIVAFVESDEIDLASQGIDKVKAKILRIDKALKYTLGLQ
ncbi:MAG: hypothetical protein HC899_05810 [Leptolyngbyaceae cyanobacterium SM1_4_3]|nr:hypothetical protein [Leptolyngbyaceae cyanobacterium SM1_4_3]NJN89144.1 hypothetical protein [Leptolyngbyaceae cyanobacterium SL_5_14]